MWKKKLVYIITAWFADDSYSSPCEYFYADTYDEAERRRLELLEDDEYEDVWVSDVPEERELWVSENS